MLYRGYMSPVKCPRCGTLNNRVREECRFCECPLENLCSDEDCAEPNVRKARFCRLCGKPTLYNLHHVFDKNVCACYTAQAKSYYYLYGDPDTPEARAEQAGHGRDFYTLPYQDNFDDLPDLPTDPEDIPYY